MALTSGFKTPRDMLAKLHREHDRLAAEVTPDNLFNLVVTAYHIVDWIKNDPAVPQPAKDDLASMRANTYLAVCRDVANASKHFTLDKNYKNQVTAKTSAISGYGVGGYGKGPYGVGEYSIVVVLTDGQRFDSHELADGVLQAWDAFFSKHGL